MVFPHDVIFYVLNYHPHPIPKMMQFVKLLLILVILFVAAYSGLRPTQSFKERSPSTSVPLRNQVTSSPPGVSVPLSAIPDSSEPDDNQVRMIYPSIIHSQHASHLQGPVTVVHT